MRINELSPAPNSKTKTKRLGRGIGSGCGKTAGKGSKGQNARSGGGVKPGFEGGQMRLLRRLPKVGFNNIFKKEYSIVNIDALNKFNDGTEITAELLKQNNIIGKIEKDGLKILGNGELKKNLIVKANKFTATAIDKIKKAGGTIEVL